ncbi:MAG: GGDEF domain-containing protein, partial [Clostridiales bacterium]|nr:GGDEF domain-containing protein [Clostridiales bacterium]
MNLFAREQQFYSNALATLRGMEDGGVLDLSHYEKIVDEYGKLLNQFNQYRNMIKVSERKQPEIIDKANCDLLTGVYNKRYLQENMDRVLGAMGRMGDMLSVIKVDVDFIKQYNETYGASEGDECIRRVAEALKNSVLRADDFVARYGGEEFVAVMPHTPEDGARLVAERMLDFVRGLEIPHSGSDTQFVTVSIGI